MLRSIILFGYSLSVSGTLLNTMTFRLDTPLAAATPTAIQNYTGTRTISVPISYVQTPIPQLQHANVNGNLSSDAAAASGFGTSCCGWGGLFGWTGTGESSATMSGNCGTGLPLSTLNLNDCLSWDSSTGYISCSTAGGFVSNAAAGCRIISPPSVFGQAFDSPTYTQIFVVCNGPAANTGYVSQLDLNGCIGITSSGQLTC
jgi:hypothetical protein